MKKIFLFILSLGLCYANSLSEDEILKHEQNCNLDIADSCTKIGIHYSNKHDLSKHNDKEIYELSKLFLEKACELNDGKGCLNLSGVYNLTADNKKYKKALEKSCDLDNKTGCEMLGLKYELGTSNFIKDTKKAKFFYKKACKLGSKMSCKYP